MPALRALPLVALAAVALTPATASAKRRTDGSRPAPASLVTRVTSVPAETLDAIGAGPEFPSSFVRQKLSTPFQRGGRPEVMSVNLAWCPHCAANSWALAVALSRFGRLASFREIDTGTYFARKLHGRPAYSHTRGISFFRVRYSSPYIAFAPVIVQDVKGRRLQRPTSAQASALATFDPDGVMPAVDVGGAVGTVGSGYSPGVLAGFSPKAIAASLYDSGNPIAQYVDGLANFFSAAICEADGNQPAAVCASPGVTAAAARLPSGG